MRSNRLAVVAALVAGAVTLAAPATAGAAPSAIGPASAVPLPDGTISPAAARAMSEGYLVPDRAAHDAAKRRAAGEPEALEPATFEPRAPVTARGWSGVFDVTSAPSDTTSAVGSTRFIELINRKFAVYNKTSNAPLRTGTLEELAGFAGNAFDPQILWDGQTNRFYYTMDVVISETDHRLAIGYSKTASPNGGINDFCHYNIAYGGDFPDYPKLGDTTDFWLIGSNVFGPSSFLRSDVAWLSKPPAGSTCVDPASFRFGVVTDLLDPTTAKAFTPVPANQVDPSSTGYVIARTLGVPSTRLSLHTVTRNADGSANIQVVGRAVTVPSYAVPPDAKQRTGFANANKELDTLDARPTQAVLAFDPARAITALWTQHTVAGGAGAEVRWYEIRPFTAGVPASGKATSASYSAFNGAISPDRIVFDTSTKRFGQSMVLGFSTSGTGSFPAVRQLSKVGTAAQSAHALVKASTANYSGFDCAGADNACRWGDYAGASPDPTPPADATRGRVWSTNQFASGVSSTTQANWRSWNWVTTP